MAWIPAAIGAVGSIMGGREAGKGAEGAQQINEARYQQGLGAIRTGTQQAIGTQQLGTQLGIGQIQRGANQQIGTVQRGAEAQLANAQRGAQMGINQIQRGRDTARNDINTRFDAGVAGYMPFRDTGMSANQRAAALSGAMGPEAQAAAQAEFNLSPGQQYLQEQGERAITRNAAALGGVQGGNVLAELQRRGVGLAGQFQQQNFDNLMGLGQQGLTAQQGIGNLRAGQGRALGDIAMTTSGRIADTIGNRTRTMGDIIGNRTTNIGNIQGTRTTNIADLIGSRTGNISDLQANRGTQIANLAGGNASQASQLAQNRGNIQAAQILGVNSAIQQGLEDFDWSGGSGATPVNTGNAGASDPYGMFNF